MKEKDLNQNDPVLGTLLRESRSTPSLPPRFQEDVWKRIERADQPEAAATRAGWLEALATRILRPQLACVVAAILIVLGASLGRNSGEQLSRSEAQARYLAVVAPNSLH